MCTSCEIPWKAIVRFTTVPTDQKQQEQMEAQIRQAYTVPSIYNPLAWGANGKKICAIFAQDKLSVDDLDFLNEQGRSLFTVY
jgi:hypothetical protein